MKRLEMASTVGCSGVMVLMRETMTPFDVGMLGAAIMFEVLGYYSRNKRRGLGPVQERRPESLKVCLPYKGILD